MATSPSSPNPSQNVKNQEQVNNPPSKWKTLGFAIAIIVGISGFAVAGIGLIGYLKVGALSHLGQIDSITMMAAGGGGGIIFLITGIIGSVKNRQKRIGTETPALSISQKGEDALPGATYGPEAWEKLGCIVVGKRPPVPTINWDEKDPFFPGKTLGETSILVFIPEEIVFNRRLRAITLNVLEEISGQKFGTYSNSVREEYGNTPIESGWVLMTKDIIPESREKSFDVQKTLVEMQGQGKGYRIPKAGEITAGILLHAQSGEQLYDAKPAITYTRCEETVGPNKLLVCVGFLNALNGLQIDISPVDGKFYGMGAVLKK